MRELDEPDILNPNERKLISRPRVGNAIEGETYMSVLWTDDTYGSELRAIGFRNDALIYFPIKRASRLEASKSHGKHSNQLSPTSSTIFLIERAPKSEPLSTPSVYTASNDCS